MHFKGLTKVWLSALLVFLINELKAQGTINVPAIECLGNLTSFNYTPPSGLTLSSASWDFGDGNSSSTNSPVHTYGAIGFYTIKINASFTNSTTAIDSIKIEIVGLPRANFYLLPQSDSCLSRNFIAFKDTSRPSKPTQTITSRLFVWGDGNFENSSAPKFGDILTHSYSVATTYALKLEVTDKYGCKSSILRSLDILENIVANAIVDTLFVDCKTAQICVRNLSTGKFKYNASYQWIVDTAAIDTNQYFNTSKCVTYTTARTGLVTMTLLLNGSCPDTFRMPFYNRLDALPTKITLLDTVWCWGNPGQFEVSANLTSNCDKCNWRLNGSFALPKYPHFYNPPPGLTKYLRSDSVIYFAPKDYYTPGKAYIDFYIYRGNDACILKDSFTVLGPVARIISYDNYQCYTNREVFFTENTQYANKNNLTYLWTFSDPNGLNCINNREKGINKYKNCNQSVDWYTKHTYSNNTSSDNQVELLVTDTVTGCSDITLGNSIFNFCPPIIKLDSVVLCQGDIFFPISQPWPDSQTIDTGKTWRKFGFVADSTMNGLYDMGFAFKTKVSPWAENFGDDSIKTHQDTFTYFDTVYRSKFLRVNPIKKDDFNLNIYGKCKPFRATLTLKNKVFKKGESLSVNWQDGISFGMTFLRDTIIDSITHLYNKTGNQTFVRISITSTKGCVWRKDLDIVFGKGYGLYIQDKNKLCGNKPVCFNASVIEFKKSYYWSSSPSMGSRKLSWKFGGNDTLINEFNPCISYLNGGKHPFQMILLDSMGCKDTIFDTLFIQKVRADVKYLSKVVYCSELKQFFDSSTYIQNKGDSIIYYSWKFGNGVFSSFVKHPLQVINTAIDSINVSHAVGMIGGCTDTVNFSLKVIGPKPYFTIKDTIGCGSLLATFINSSRTCKSYLWEFGDPLNSTLQTTSKLNTTFNYTKAGRYYISLTGYDTVVNQLTGKTFYCKNTFPDQLFQKDTTRSVLVLPFRTTGIQSKDTICLGSALQLQSLSDTGYSIDYWQLGDSATTKIITGATISHLYTKAGSYMVKLNPGYTDSIMNRFCKDSAQKNIVVIEVKADFTIDTKSVAPLFKFQNTSIPLTSKLEWNFGQVSSSNNTSTDQNPSHDYGNDTGTYNVCLIASSPEGCTDTICKTVFNDHLTAFQLFNVFTPGAIDGKNDQYDILIEGEEMYDLEIYNRWGVLVFKGDMDGDATNQNNWNGKVNNKGEDCPSGTYYYIFNYRLKGETESKTTNGVITLIR